MDATNETDGQWWSQRWRSQLSEVGAIKRVLPTAQGIRVKGLEVKPGRINAQLQDEQRGGCEVEIRIRPWSDDQWRLALDFLSDQALYVAQLLSGAFPPELDRSLAAAGVLLLPAQADEIDHECSCCNCHFPACDHLTAVYVVLGNMLADDPWLLFRLRGRGQQQVLRALGRHRARATNSPSAAPMYADADGRGNGDTSFYHAGSDSGDPNAIRSLEMSVEQYWGSLKEQEEFHPQLIRPSVELVLLRRLGPPPFSSAGTDTFEVLAKVYESISEAAITLAFAADPIDHVDGNKSGTAS